MQPDGGRAPADDKIARALADTERAARPLKHASHIHASLSQLLAASGRRGEAVERLKRALALPPGRAEDQEALAFAAFNLGQHHIGRELYARVAEMRPLDATAWYNLATGERSLGNLTAAEAASSRALELDPLMFKAYLFRSQLQNYRGFWQGDAAAKLLWLFDGLCVHPGPAEIGHDTDRTSADRAPTRALER